MGREETCGHPLISVFSIADHCFISSEMGGIFGRSRMVCVFCLAARFRFVFFIFITGSGGHGPGAARREQELGLGEGLDLLEGGVGSEFTQEKALRRNVDEGKFGDDVIHDFDTC